MKLAWLWVALGALAIRLVALAVTLPALKPDVDLDHYRSVARSVAQGDGFAVNGVPNVARTPVYPLLLAGLMRVGGDRLGLFLAVQCVLGAVTCGLTVCLASRWLSPLAATIAGTIVALDPNSVVRCLDLRTEILFTLLLMAGAWLLMKDRGALAGLVWSLAALSRPIAVFLPVIALVYWLVKRQRPVRLLSFGLCFAPLLAVWMVRNAQVTGEWFISSISTINLLHYHAAGLEKEPLAETQARYLREFGSAEFCEDRTAFTQRIRGMRARAFAVIVANPVEMARQLTISWGKVMFGPGARSLDNSLREPQAGSRWWAPVYVVGLVALWILAAAGAWRLRHESIPLAALILYFVILAGGANANSRFRTPVVPMLAILAVAGVKR